MRPTDRRRDRPLELGRAPAGRERVRSTLNRASRRPWARRGRIPSWPDDLCERADVRACFQIRTRLRRRLATVSRKLRKEFCATGDCPRPRDTPGAPRRGQALLCGVDAAGRPRRTRGRENRTTMPPTAFAPTVGAPSSFAGRPVAAAARCPAARAPQMTPAARRSPTMTVYNVEINFHGTKHVVPIDENQTLLEGIESVGLEVPYSCRAGVCMTCAAKIVEGDVDLGEIAMMDDLKEEGYVLTCSGMPRGEGIKLEMNQFDVVYEQQYGQNEIGARAK
jgi:ferredoxin